MSIDEKDSRNFLILINFFTLFLYLFDLNIIHLVYQALSRF